MSYDQWKATEPPGADEPTRQQRQRDPKWSYCRRHDQFVVPSWATCSECLRAERDGEI